MPSAHPPFMLLPFPGLRGGCSSVKAAVAGEKPTLRTTCAQWRPLVECNADELLLRMC